MNLKNSLCLFETSMPIRVNMKEIDEKNEKLENNENISEKIFEKYKNNEKYVLHDGPPYANGPIHLGHAYNKIMKDICIRSHFMMEYNAYTIPGWDTHGLPIEHKIISQKEIPANKVKPECRKFASKWIEDQKKSFKKLGVLMDFKNPYVTMNYEYESDIIKSFCSLVEKGYIVRSNKTIPWCYTCQTSLANAEIEYKNRKDPSLYILFHLDKKANNLFFLSENETISLTIWTTTPWTVPLNRGVILKKNSQYLLLEYNSNFLIIGKESLSDFEKKTDKKYKIKEEFNSSRLQNIKVCHPFEKDITVPVILDESVENSEGTACVHTAPGCGPIDYEIGIKNNLEIYSPINKSGEYTEKCNVPELIGKKISAVHGWVISELKKKNILWHKGSINHSYPHCWRSKTGLIFRATPQWFCVLEKDNLKKKVLDAIKNIHFYPKNSLSFLESTISNRWEWCISRQRSWGVPIIAFINKKDGSSWTNPKIIDNIAEKIKIHGIEYWDTVSFDDLKPYIPANITEDDWKKETDILDVWFDSGVSHRSVLKKNNQFPADVYLEGVDQHRGWFQSSLLTSIILNNTAPMKNIISCGHTVDEKGQKMSKSLGNVISPEQIIDMIGLDGLRLWTASVTLGGDITVGKKIFQNIGEVYRKIRNTCRFAIQNIVDFDPQKDSVTYDSLGFINQLILKKMFEYQVSILYSYQTYNFTEVFHTIIEIITTFLSSFYFDISKDILYCNKANSPERRQTQTTIYIILETLTRLFAPILKNTSEEITSYYKSGKKKSIHLETFYTFPILTESKTISELYKFPSKKPFTEESIIKIYKKLKNNEHTQLLEILKKLRELVFKKTEILREKSIIKQSIETKVIIKTTEGSKYHKLLKILEEKYKKNNFKNILCQVLLISDVEIFFTNEINEEIEAIAEKHTGIKCERCWKYFYPQASEVICKRCQEAIKN